MILTISRKTALKKYTSFPQKQYNRKSREYDLVYPDSCKDFILTLGGKTFKSDVKLLGPCVTDLLNELGMTSLVFCMDYKLPWLFQTNEFRYAKDAGEYLLQKGIDKNFNGAIQVDLTDLPEFMQHISWLIRCNASLPDIYFMDPGQNILGTICQYGNIHLSVLDWGTLHLFASAIQRSKFKTKAENNCSEQYGRTGPIVGRQILL